MSIKILVKRGLEADLASAGVAAGELKFTTDTKKLYIGTGSENVQIGGDGAGSWGSIAGDIEDQADLQAALGGKVPTTRTINNKALTADVVLKMSDLQNDANYAKIANVDAAGHKLNVSMDTTDYVLTLKLLDKNENVIDIKSVDLPLEELVISGSYDATNKKIVLTLKSGQTIEIPVANLLAGLVNATRQVGSNDLSDDITPTQLFNDIKDLTGTLTNKTVDADDNDVTNLTVDNFKTGVIVGTLSATPSDKKIPNEKLLADLLALKQNITDNTLNTTNKTIVGAINELKEFLTNGTIDCGTF
ncbi:MAG: hypothetical protein IJ593_11455 [Lachnospiraceae bacterium]|nr:hypothetical protein [Lachnospiraceae bacterium]